MDDTTVRCWGAATSAPITGGGDALRPTAVPGVANVVQIAAGYYHTYAVRSDGSVAGWGVETQDGVATSDRTVPVDVSGLPLSKRVGTGIQHGCAAANDQTVWCWGSDQYGAIGVRLVGGGQGPLRVGTLTQVTDVAAGGFTSCAVSAQAGGTLWCWGNQRGDGTTVFDGTPYDVLMNSVQQVCAGETHICARAADASVRCWGGSPQDGGTGGSTTPRLVAGLDGGVLTIGCGVASTCAVMSDRSVRCWGSVTAGAAATLTPTAITGIVDAAAVAPGNGHVCVLRMNGAVVCWGDNTNGQLGDGTRMAHATPMPVLW